RPRKRMRIEILGIVCARDRLLRPLPRSQCALELWRHEHVRRSCPAQVAFELIVGSMPATREQALRGGSRHTGVGAWRKCAEVACATDERRSVESARVDE